MSDERHEVVFSNLGRTITVPDNANLRDACRREGIRLYRGLARVFNCEGRARCGTCRVRIVDGAASLSAPSPFEKPHLDGSPDSERLACQVNVRGRVVVETLT